MKPSDILNFMAITIVAGIMIFLLYTIIISYSISIVIIDWVFIGLGISLIPLSIIYVILLNKESKQEELKNENRTKRWEW